MPPKKRASLAEDYSSDGGFVANDSDSDRPKAKKPKTAKSNNSTKPTGNKPSSSTKSIGGGGVETAEEVFWEVSGKKRVTLSEYRGKMLVSFREYYEKNGEVLPSKKGISLPIDQFSAIVKLLPHIEAVLEGKGIQVPRPEYGGAGGEGAGGDEEEGEEPASKVAEKKNFETTSEEEGE